MDDESLFGEYTGFDALIGLEILEHGDELVLAQLPVRDALCWPSR